MGSFRATLKLKGKELDVLFSNIEFSRKTDNKGKPVTNVFGGRITLTIESTEDTSIIESMVNNQFSPIDGCITFKRTDVDVRQKQILFSNGYIVYYKEVFNAAKTIPMCITVTFSAKEISIGHALLNNRW